MIRFPKFITTMIVVAISSATFAQTQISKAAAYINKYKDLAIAEMLRTGVPASITLAQGILETGGGQSDLASMANNHFGIKCKSDWMGETMLHDDDAKNECFRKYPSVEASYQDHSTFLRTRPLYAFLFKLDPTDYEGWAKGLKKAGYATSPTYSQKLMKIIVENNLQEVTLIALNGRQNLEPELFASNDIRTTGSPEPIFIEKEEISSTTKPVINTSAVRQKAADLPTTLIRKNIYPSGQVFTINDTKVMYAEAGVSLLAVANNYNLSFKKILEYNELDEVEILEKDQLIFLQKKPKKGNKDVHVVEANESLHEICQKEGIQLLSVMEYNRLQKGMEPAKGESLYLKFPAPVSPKLAANERAYAINSMR